MGTTSCFMCQEMASSQTTSSSLPVPSTTCTGCCSPGCLSASSRSTLATAATPLLTVSYVISRQCSTYSICIMRWRCVLFPVDSEECDCGTQSTCADLDSCCNVYQQGSNSSLQCTLKYVVYVSQEGDKYLKAASSAPAAILLPELIGWLVDSYLGQRRNAVPWCHAAAQLKPVTLCPSPRIASVTRAPNVSRRVSAMVSPLTVPNPRTCQMALRVVTI